MYLCWRYLSDFDGLENVLVGLILLQDNERTPASLPKLLVFSTRKSPANTHELFNR